MSADPVAELRTHLLAGVSRRRARYRRGRATVAGAAAVALLAAAALTAARPDGALGVTRGPAEIELRIEDASAGAATMTAELRAAGIRGEVRRLPVEPGLAGTWVAALEVSGRDCGDPRPDAVRLGEVGVADDRLTLPVETVRKSTGTFIFYAGRAVEAGEQPADIRAAIDADVRRRPRCPAGSSP